MDAIKQRVENVLKALVPELGPDAAFKYMDDVDLLEFAVAIEQHFEILVNDACFYWENVDDVVRDVKRLSGI